MINCDECVHFPTPNSPKWKKECRSYTCEKQQRIPFRNPTSPIDDEWGFIKESCRLFDSKKQLLESSPAIQKQPFSPVVIFGGKRKTKEM